jgi:hypothetical protein
LANDVFRNRIGGLELGILAGGVYGELLDLISPFPLLSMETNMGTEPRTLVQRSLKKVASINICGIL